MLPDYGTGAIMAVPAHDQRDLDFARAHGLPVRVVVDTGQPDPVVTGIATAGDGKLINSGPLDGLGKAGAIAYITAILGQKGLGHAAVSYRLRGIRWSPGSGSGGRRSRSSTAHPAVRCRFPKRTCRLSCPTCAGRTWFPRRVAAAAATDWVNGYLPQCGGPAKRDTDTMDRFVDSSWYFLRYCSPHYADGPFDPGDLRRLGAG